MLCLVFIMLASCGVKKDDRVTVTFDPYYNMGDDFKVTNAKKLELEIKVEKGGKIGKLPKPTADGYTFVGWYAEEDEEFAEKYKSTTKVEADITLVAKWVVGGDTDPDNNINITFELGNIADVTNRDSLKLSVIADAGKAIGTLPEPIAKSYDFDGWYDEDDTEFESKITSSDVFDADTVLVAKWTRKAGVMCDPDKHDYVEIERVDETCTKNGYVRYECSLCGAIDKQTLRSTGHSYQTEEIEQTCGQDGYVHHWCEKCGFEYDDNIKKATGQHEFNKDASFVTTKPTYFLPGVVEYPCGYCDATEAHSIDPLGKADFAGMNIGAYKYTGGKYANSPFINLATKGVATFSSYYATCIGYNAIDGSVTSYWAPDTLADGANFAGEWLQVQLVQAYDIGKVQLTVPNYNAWGLGEGCYVEYKIEAFVDGGWKEIGVISDKDYTSDSLNAVISVELAEPVNTDKIRATIEHSGRNTPATIYEFEVYGYVEQTERVAEDIVGTASVTVSGKFNEWAAGAEALTDGDLGSAWLTDARDWITGGKGITNAEYECKDDDGKRVYKKVTKVTINADKYVGETINVLLWTEIGKDDKGNAKYGWEKVATLTIDENSPESVSQSFNINKSASAVRFEVKDYGSIDGGDVNTVKSIVVCEDGADHIYDDISWNLPKRTRATITLPQNRYIACVKWVTNNANKTFVVEKLIDGEWIKVGEYDQDSENKSLENGRAVYSVDINDKVEAVRIELTKESMYWESYVYEIMLYTLVESGIDVPVYNGCKHKLSSRDYNEVVEPTCTSAGYTKTKCINEACELYYHINATDALGHDYGEWEMTDVISALNSMNVEKATCTRDGCGAFKTRSCSDTYDAPVITDWYNNAPGAWSMTFDDGNYISTYNWVIPRLAEYGYRATAVLAVSMMDAYVKEWKGYIETGTFDIGSHSYEHKGIYSGSMSVSTGLRDVNTAYYWLMNTFKGQRVLGFATPNGSTSKSAAEFITGIMAAGRNGGQGGTGGIDSIFYNTLDELNTRTKWGNLNSYVSKATQTEGKYEFVKRADLKAEEEKDALVNYVFDKAQNKLVVKKTDGGTYVYDEENYRYTWYETGSYDKNGDKYTFRNDNGGEYILAHTEKGSYEQAVDILIEHNSWTVECIHSLGSGSIYSTYVSTISKFEYLKKTGVWVGSYNDVIQYVKEAQNATVDTVAMSDNTIEISLTHTLDTFMYNHPLTVKIDIGSWGDITATQGGEALEYFIEGGYAYVNAVPNSGNIVITKK